ncbi:MAG: MmgE/PrpD family protein [Planctomycetes bacterium]|nr:MmgE/PrpD family protein [Planctomycetota bacterium]
MATVGRRIAQWVKDQSYKDLDEKAIHEVKRRVLDSIGCALGAYRAKPCRIARAVGESVNDTRAGTILGTRHSTSPDLETDS